MRRAISFRSDMFEFSQEEIARFWSKVDKEHSQTFYNGTRCWEWIASKNRYGYGQLTNRQQHYEAHRVSFVFRNGSIPSGMHILHYCDNPACVNPDHLHLGTHQQNMADMVSKGRTKKGERHWNSKLTEDEVFQIRKRYGRRGIGGEDSSSLSKEFQVSVSTIMNIVNEKNWSSTG